MLETGEWLNLAERSSQSIVLIIALSWSSRGGVQTPPSLEWLRHLAGLTELEDAGLSGHNRALVHWGQLGHQLCHEPAGLLWVEVASLLGNVNNAGDDLVVTLLLTFLGDTAGSADLHGKFLTGGVSHELTRLFLHILGAAGGLVHSPTLLRSLTVTNLLHRFVAFLNRLVESFLFEGDGAKFLKVLLADLLLGGLELSDVGVVTLLGILVSALQDGILLQRRHFRDLVHTAEASVRVGDTAAEVNTARDGLLLSALAASPREPGGGRGAAEEVSSCCSDDNEKTGENLQD